MARYVTSGARYNPFDFNAMWKSAEAATQAHYTQGAQFAALAEQMAPYETLKYNPVDAEDYKQVTQYNQQLNDAVTKFQKQGLSGGSFNNFLQLSKNYSTNIKPLEIGLKQREQYKNIVMQQQVADPTYEPVRTANQISLREFAQGGVTPYGVSGTRVQQEVATIMSRIATEPNSDITIQSINKYYNLIKSRTGYTMDDVLKFINDPNASDQKTKIMKSIVDGVVMSQKGFSELTPEAQQRIYSYGLKGAYGAVGTTHQEVKESQWYQEANLGIAQEQLRMAQEDHLLNNELIKSKIYKNYKDSEELKKNGPIDYYKRSNAGDISSINKEYQTKRDAWNLYKEDKAKGGVNKVKRPNTNGLGDAGYEQYLLDLRDKTLLENSRYSINPKTAKEQEDFYKSLFKSSILNSSIKKGSNSNKSTTLREVLDDRSSKYSRMPDWQYLKEHGTFYLDPKVANPRAGILLDIDDETYVIPYSAFGGSVQTSVSLWLNSIDKVLGKTDTRTLKEYQAVTDGVYDILNSIYSTTVKNGSIDGVDQPSDQTSTTEQSQPTNEFDY